MHFPSEVDIVVHLHPGVEKGRKMDTVLDITYLEGPLCNGRSPFIFYLQFFNKHLYPSLEEKKKKKKKELA